MISKTFWVFIVLSKREGDTYSVALSDAIWRCGAAFGRRRADFSDRLVGGTSHAVDQVKRLLFDVSVFSVESDRVFSDFAVAHAGGLIAFSSGANLVDDVLALHVLAVELDARAVGKSPRRLLVRRAWVGISRVQSFSRSFYDLRSDAFAFWLFWKLCLRRSALCVLAQSLDVIRLVAVDRLLNVAPVIELLGALDQRLVQTAAKFKRLAVAVSIERLDGDVRRLVVNPRDARWLEHVAVVRSENVL